MKALPICTAGMNPPGSMAMVFSRQPDEAGCLFGSRKRDNTNSGGGVKRPAAQIRENRRIAEIPPVMTEIPGLMAEKRRWAPAQRNVSVAEKSVVAW